MLCQGARSQKHPHGRGEDRNTPSGPVRAMETPPRTWGRPAPASVVADAFRNTPTDVGKTVSVIMLVPKPQKHPHGRGEDSILCRQSGTAMETPPRTWGRRSISSLSTLALGNTPTDVGKTMTIWSWSTAGWKPPHGRGEDDTSGSTWMISPETPPRTWGRRRGTARA